MKKKPLIAAVIVANLVLVLAVVNGAIWKKQSIVDDGKVVMLELAPVDPRSLMQGDYMILNFALNRDQALRTVMAEAPTRGALVLEVDKLAYGEFKRFERDESQSGELAVDEVRLRYRKSRRGLQFGIESFFFQEGLADTFANAKFAEVRVSPTGEAVLVGLRDEAFKKLGD